MVSLVLHFLQPHLNLAPAINPSMVPGVFQEFCAVDILYHHKYHILLKSLQSENEKNGWIFTSCYFF